jgi:hypothetical protein
MGRGLRNWLPSHASLGGTRSLVAAIIFAIAQWAALYLAARADSSLRLPDEATGLLEHPGMMAIVLGNALLPVISSHARSLTCNLGRKLPCSKPLLIRRYYKARVLRHVFGIDVFITTFLFLAAVGFLYLLNQTIVLSSPDKYYDHDTFDSYAHIWSFYVSRPILFISWSVIIPWFAATLLAHVVAVYTLLTRVRRRSWSSFNLSHPDRCGGYSFFGWADVGYAFGIAVVLTEAALVIITHDKLTVGSFLALGGITIGALLISFFSVLPVLKTLREQERQIKSGTFHRLRRGGPLDLQRSAILFDLRFTPYTGTAARLALAARLMIALPYSVSSLIVA